MKVKISSLVLIIYLSFALDSALKINAGVQLHLGIIGILLFNCVLLVNNPKVIPTTLSVNKILLLFSIWFLFSFLFTQIEGGAVLLLYLLIAINVMVYCSYTEKYFDFSFVKKFQYLMLFSGLIQFLAYKTLGYQISFIDPEHYEKGFSVSERLRGFFLEPNWFAIALAFNTFLLFGNDPIEAIKKQKLLCILTLFVFLVNGSLAPLGILVLTYSFPYLRKKPLKGGLMCLVLLCFFLFTYEFRGNIKSTQNTNLNIESSILNHSSRLIPVIRTFDHQVHEGFEKFVFGQGVGAWATIAVPNGLSALVFEAKAGVRDGSEVPVVFFELGFLGIALLLFDSISLFFKSKKEDFHYKGAVILFLVCLFFYPTFKFWMYMPYYFYIRARINGKYYFNTAKRESKLYNKM
ncbi:membrane hypothetical protein [Vibrio coralliirubri]|uniref:hypothetical protein n=1 Tax=Vibrio coralliirubri TaxID=1516159 RepID=UPI00063376E6|nr:hypothetical protein [Vibrio coralliirubri]CDT89235.1 membrane hypothetical protein [Vibrio coralliirubri]